MDTSGHLPQIRRSSLSEEEEQKMEMEAMNTVIGNNNVVFKDAIVKNMSMNIVNNHTHTHEHRVQSKETDKIKALEEEIRILNETMEQMMQNKMKLVMNT